MDLNLLEQKNELVRKIRMENDADIILFLADCLRKVKQPCGNPFEKIPGVAYSDEELQRAVEQGMEEYRNGLAISNEEFFKQVETW
jgi:hypothetical protein